MSQQLTCSETGSQIYSSFPLEVLNHCANHGYDDLANKAAFLTISLANPIEEALGGLSDLGVARKWVLLITIHPLYKMHH
jgi:hypothetical protein